MSLPLNAIPKIAASFSSSLSSKIEATDTSLTLDSGTDDAGNAFDGVVGLTVEGEWMIGTKSGTSVTGLLRGIDPQDGTTERTALKQPHNRGAVVKVTDFAFLAIAYRLLNGDEGFPNKIKYPSSQTPTLGQYQIVDWDYIKAYADGLAIAGAPDASQTTKGIVEQATASELAAGTATGGTGAALFGSPDALAAQIQSGSWQSATTGGTSTAYTLTLTPALTAYATGQPFFAVFHTANGATPTLNVNGLGAKTLKKYVQGVKSDLAASDLLGPTLCMYDGTHVVCLNLTNLPTTALISEMATFFGATDMTGAEAETLTAGASSDASSLHYHKSANGTTTKNAADASTTQNIAHGLGYAPHSVRITFKPNTSNAKGYGNELAYNGTTASVIGTYADGFGGVNVNNGTTVILNTNDGSAGTQIGTITVDATNIIITWVKAASPTGTYLMLWEAS